MCARATHIGHAHCVRRYFPTGDGIVGPTTRQYIGMQLSFPSVSKQYSGVQALVSTDPFGGKPLAPPTGAASGWAA